MTHALVSGATGGVGPKGAGGMTREEEPCREVALAHRLASVGSWVGGAAATDDCRLPTTELTSVSALAAGSPKSRCQQGLCPSQGSRGGCFLPRPASGGSRCPWACSRVPRLHLSPHTTSCPSRLKAPQPLSQGFGAHFDNPR